jgi:MYXO-CTERM domain-containing protein
VFSGLIPPGFGNAGPSLDTILYLPEGDYYCSIQAVDGGFAHSEWSDERAFTVDVLHSPSDISLSSGSVAENQPANTVVGSLSSIDLDTGDTFTYSLVAGTGSADNVSFTITSNTLRTNAVFDYEARNSYSIRVRTTDQEGLYREESFNITVTNVNESPIDISLSDSSVAEEQLTNTIVGAFSTTDPDNGNTCVYSLVSGTGDADNSSFTITDTILKTDAVFDYEIKDSYSIRVRTTDQGGLYFEKQFTISITNVYEGIPGDKWYLENDLRLERSPEEQTLSAGVPSGGDGTIWQSRYPAPEGGISFEKGTWVIFLSTDNWMEQCDAEIGVVNSVGAFKLIEAVNLQKSWNNGILTVRETTGQLDVGEGFYLALRVKNSSEAEKTIQTHDGLSYIEVPPDDPPWPVPELASGLLMGLGLTGLGGYVLLRRRRNQMRSK